MNSLFSLLSFLSIYIILYNILYINIYIISNNIVLHFQELTKTLLFQVLNHLNYILYYKEFESKEYDVQNNIYFLINHFDEFFQSAL